MLRTFEKVKLKSSTSTCGEVNPKSQKNPTTPPPRPPSSCQQPPPQQPSPPCNRYHRSNCSNRQRRSNRHHSCPGSEKKHERSYRHHHHRATFCIQWSPLRDLLRSVATTAAVIQVDGLFFVIKLKMCCALIMSAFVFHHWL